MLLSTETNSVVKRFGQERAFEMLKKTGFDACDFSFYNNGVELLGDDYMKNAEKSKTAEMQNEDCYLLSHAL